MSSVLIAGGAGFLGSHLAERLLARGDDVAVVDNLITGRRANLPSHARLNLVEGDAATAQLGRYDLVFHLASPASPVAYARHAIATLLANALVTKRMLELCAATGARMLLASTSEVYGDPLVHPQPESYWGNVNPIGPRSQYDEGKRFAEALSMAFVRERSAQVVVARIFNSYGPRMGADDGRMPSAFITAALKGRPIVVYGDGTQTRSLCYVDDTVDGLLAVMERGAAGEVYNVGRDDETNVLDFARLVLELTGSRSEITFAPARADEVHKRRPDLAKIRGSLGWTSRVELRTGLERTIGWFRDAAR